MGNLGFVPMQINEIMLARIFALGVRFFSAVKKTQPD
jgi:hypothetical protein